MAQFTASLYAQIAAGLYVITSLACFWSGLAAREDGRQAWHWQVWMIVGLLFVLMALMRHFSIEEMVRHELRSWLVAQSAYEARRETQAKVVAIVIGGAVAAGAFWVFRGRKSMRSSSDMMVHACGICALMMTVLIGVRIISLHQIDKILYGPMKMNWFADIGLSVAILVLAAAYAFRARGGTTTTNGRHRT